MTTPADVRAAEQAFEAALAGRSGSADARALTAFTDAVRAGATAPGRPNAALAELLATGLLTDPSRTTVGRPARSSRKRPHMILSTLVAKFAAAGIVAKASVAGGAVAIVLTGAVTTEVLPVPGEDPTTVQSGDVASDTSDGGLVVESEVGGDSSTGGEEVRTSEDGAADAQIPGVVSGPAEPLSYTDWIEGPVDGEPFGPWVSAGAREGWTTGAVVSCFARARQDRTDRPTAAECSALAAAPVEDEQVTVDAEGPAPEAGVVEEEAAPAPAPAPAPSGDGAHGSGSAGAGNGGGNAGNGGGNGNAGNGGGSGNAGNGGGNGNGGGRR